MREFKPYDRNKYNLDPRSDDEILADRESTVLYFHPLRENLKRMSLAQKGRLLDSMLDWAELEKETDLEDDPLVANAFDGFRSQERVNRTKYLKSARKGKQAVEEREGKKREQLENDPSSDDDESG